MSHASLTRAFQPSLKPSQKPRTIPAVRVYPDGREVCATRLADIEGAEGRAEYRRRKKAMWKRQKGHSAASTGLLPECPGKLSLKQATFEHEDGRGAGGSKRDDKNFFARRNLDQWCLPPAM